MFMALPVLVIGNSTRQLVLANPGNCLKRLNPNLLHRISRRHALSLSRGSPAGQCQTPPACYTQHCQQQQQQTAWLSTFLCYHTADNRRDLKSGPCLRLQASFKHGTDVRFHTAYPCSFAAESQARALQVGVQLQICNFVNLQLLFYLQRLSLGLSNTH